PMTPTSESSSPALPDALPIWRLELQLLTVRGTLREMSSEHLRLDGLTLWLSPATQRRGTVRVGQSISATVVRLAQEQYLALVVQDRKSTRLNSSHVKISYAVF